MTPSKQVPPSPARDAYEPPTPTEELEQAATAVELGAGAALRTVEIALAVFFGLLICPPLFILVVIVALPLVVTVAIAAIVGGVVLAPVLLIRHLRGHHNPHVDEYRARVRHAAHALVELLPHRVHGAATAASRKGRRHA